MKRVIFIITFAFCCLLPASSVYAGALNVYEQQVIAEAKKVYIYRGQEYRVTADYIDQLVAYLSRSEVDITAEQRDQALQAAYDSIEQGVRKGYLVPVEKAEVKATPTPTIAVISDRPKLETETSELPTPDISGTVKAGPTQTPPPKKPPKVTENNAEIPTVEPEEIEKLFEAIPTRDMATGSISNVSDASIITETGFNLDNTLIVIMGILILMTIALIATIRLDYFAHSDE